MWINYLKIAFRTLIKNKTYSLINIGGLAIGMACTLLILLWIQDEFTVDNFHENGDQLYQVYLRTTVEGQVNASYNSPALLPAYLKDEIPEIEMASGYAKVLRLSQQGATYETFQVGDMLQKMSGSRAGADFFQMFSYPLLQGRPTQALDEPNDIAISHKMANQFFGSPELAIGKSMEINNDRLLTVSAVFEDLPTTVSNRFDYLLNWDYWVRNDEFKQLWGHFGTLTYVQLQPGTDPGMVEEKMRGILNGPLGIAEDDNVQIDVGLQAFSSQYLNGNFENGQPTGSRIIYIRLLGFVALFILIVAIINFTNLSAARSLRRTLEVGIRKVVGAKRGDVAQQFFVEGVLLAILALPPALFLVQAVLPPFNQFTQKAIVLPLNDALLVVAFLASTILIGLLAGLYPAIILSTLKANKVLKGGFNSKFRNLGLQKSLIVFQFTLAILLIIGTIVITQQANFLQSKDLGYDRENVLYLPLEGALIENYLTFKEEALRMPGVKYVDRSSQTPHNMGFSGTFVNWDGAENKERVTFTPNSVGYEV